MTSGEGASSVAAAGPIYHASESGTAWQYPVSTANLATATHLTLRLCQSAYRDDYGAEYEIIPVANTGTLVTVNLPSSISIVMSCPFRA